MRRLYDYKCSDGHVSEHFVEDDVREVECAECGNPASRIITPINFHLEGWSGHFPTAKDKWIRDHERGAKANHE